MRFLALLSPDLDPIDVFMASVMPVKEEVGLGIAVVLTFIGMVLHWQLPRQRMAAEEQMKDGTLTEEQVNRRMRFLSICAPIATVAGVLLLLAVLFSYTN